MALSKQSESYVENMLECSVCLDTVKDPHTLKQCFHSYCKECVDQLIDQQNNQPPGVKCPVCRAFSPGTEIRQNFFINDLADMHRSSKSNQTPLCSQCPGDPLEALWKCVDCKLNLCQKCHISHLKIPLLQGHRILPLTEDTEMVVDRLVFCTIHKDKPIELYCEPCNIAICMKCAVTTHRAHISKTVEDALEKLVPEIEGSTKILDEHLEAIEKSLVDVDQKVVETKAAFDESRSEVDKVANERVKQIRAAQNKLNDELNLKEKAELEKLGETKVSLQDRQKEGNNLKKVVRTSLDRARHATLLSELLQGGISDKVQSIKKRQSRNPANIDIHKPVVHVNHKQWNAMSYEGTMGSLTFNIISLFVMGGYSKTGKVGPRYWSVSFKDFFSKPLKKKTEIVLPTAVYNISVIKNQIWVSSLFSTDINIYNIDGALVKTLNIPSSNAVEESPSGDIFIACRENGLNVLVNDSEKHVKIHDGDIVDVCAYECRVYCLDRNKKCITELVQETDRTSWQVARKIHIAKYDGSHLVDRMIVRKKLHCLDRGLQFFIGSRGAHTVMEFNENGKLVKQYGGRNEQGETKLNYPNLCGIDSHSKILVADENNKYKILDPEDGQWTHTGLYVQGRITDAKLDSAGTLWCLQNNGTKDVVVQYQHEQ